MLTFKDLQDIEAHLKDTFATKDELQKVKSDLMTVLAKILKNTEATNKNFTVLTHQVKNRTDRLEKIESHLGLAAS